MSFNSLEFALFLPIIFILNWLLPRSTRWVMLLGASYWFYMSWKPIYALLMLAATIITWIAGWLISRTEVRKKRVFYFVVGLAIPLGILFIFKYFNFFSREFSYFLNSFNIISATPTLKILLPVGISFYTFQTMSYLIDIYSGTIKPEKNIGIYATYVSFFPQLVAGPIERAGNLLGQFHNPSEFDYQRSVDGLRLIAFGLFKKLVIADRIAIYVNTVYAKPAAYSGFPLILATWFFAFQIFCDFSAYTDIARGSAKLLGYELMENFRRPYFALNIRDFWARWHISLSGWFRDYLYIPLGGSRTTAIRYSFNIMIVFLLSGLWHGASRTFIIWGGLHGLFLITGHFTLPARKSIAEALFQSKFIKTRNFLNILITFQLVSFAWIFFRARTFSEALSIIKNMFSGLSLPLSWAAYKLPPLFNRLDLMVALVSILVLESIHFMQEKYGLNLFVKLHWILRWSLYILLALWIQFFGVFSRSSEFIYFRF